ncbi:MAG TPA: alginate export family protein [Sphingomonadaceae bacterium]|nr:alginate export family protein [Sphingomonadaceae bacterium]
MNSRILLLTGAALVAWSNPALAKVGDPVEIGGGVTVDPQLNLNLRYESVSEDNAKEDADALTLRARFGLEFKAGDGFSLLAEGEATGALIADYNDTLPGNGNEPYSTVADPENVELNRLQVGYMKDGNGITIGRQRINLDDQRFVGAVGWRQNEQTFDAVRGQAKLGPVKLDATYAISQRTIFGVDSPNGHFDGDLVLLNATAELKPVTVTVFAYLVDYDTRLAFSSDTFGFRALGTFTLVESVKLNAVASYASQSDAGSNPNSYSADFFNGELGVAVSGFNLKGGYEYLGADEDATCLGAGCGAFQTPLATLHAFNGWADLFLTTPFVAGSYGGIQDYYASIAYSFPGVTAIPGLNATLVYHSFDSAFGSMDYGSEVNASLGFRLGPVGMLVKYANYQADGFGVDTEKLWLQAGISF